MDGGVTSGERSNGRLAAVVTAIVLLGLGVASIGAAFLDRGARADARPDDRIAFVGLDGRLATIDPAGGEPVPLSPGGRRFSFPAWSPDGTRVAAIEVSEAGGAVVVADAARGAEGRAPLTNLHVQAGGVPIYLYWAPGGRHVSMLVQGTETLDLLLAGADGRSPPARIATGQPLYWDWADSGRSVLVHTGLVGSGAMRLLDAAGLERDAAFERPGIFQSPSVAASGRWFAYSVAGEGASGSLVIVDRTGLRRTMLDQAGLVAFGWGPTTDRLAILAGGQPAPFPIGPLRVLDPTSGRLDVLVSGAILAFAWAPDGRSIAAIGLPERDPGGLAQGGGGTARSSGDAALTALAGLPDPRAAAPAPAPPAPAALAPAQGEIRLSVTIVDVPTAETRVVATFRPTPLWIDQWLPFFDQYVKSHRLWSPRSDAIVLPIRTDDERSRIAVIPIDGSGERIIADGAMPAWSP